METIEIEKKFRRTAQRQKRRDLCAVLLFLFLLPYACSLLFAKEKGETVPWDDSQIRVVCAQAAGDSQIPLETYVAGTLAASIPAGSNAETMKAQAVILRTMCMNAYEQREKIEDNVVDGERIGQEYLDTEDMKNLWGDSFEENWQKTVQAVAATKGMYMTCEGRVIVPAYFQLSAGRTRSGEEVFGDGYGYLSSVDCSHDIESENFSGSFSIPQKQFFDMLEKGMAAKEGTDSTPAAENGDGKVSLLKDSAGYVLKVEWKGKSISGESFRYLFSLPSSCFTIGEKNGDILIETKGVGHGLGFDQYAAEMQADQGSDYIALLKYFFTGIEIEKIE